MNARRFPRRGTPESFGWLRLPSHDAAGLVAWEQPTGVLYLVEPGTRVVQLLPSLPPQPDLAVVKR